MAKQKVLLIIGAGFEQLPAIQLAKSMGYKVVVSDLNPDAAGVNYADEFGQISTNNKSDNLAFAKQHQIDGVMTLGSELAVPVVAYVAENLDLPGANIDTALKATNKNVMHRAFRQNSVPTPQSNRVNTLAQLKAFVEEWGWPLVIKPSDSSGQRGVTFLHEESPLEAALQEALHFSTDDYAIVEQYVSGPEINVTAIVQEGEIYFLSFSHRVTAEPPHFGIAIEHRAPVDISESALKSVREASEKAIRAIGLRNGIAYPQVIASPQGSKVLEIAARIPGGYMREVALICSGIDMIEVVIRQALSETLPIVDYIRHPSSESVLVKFITELDLPADLKVMSQISGFEQVQKMPEVFLANCRLKEGEAVPALDSSVARFAAIITCGDSIHASEKRLSEALNEIVLK